MPRWSFILVWKKSFLWLSCFLSPCYLFQFFSQSAGCFGCFLTIYFSSFFTVLFHLFRSVHLFLFILLFLFFSALAFASLTGVVVVIVMRILSDHVVVVVVSFGYTYSENIHINISFLALKHIGSDTAIQTLHFLYPDLQTCVLMFAVLYRIFVVTYLWMFLSECVFWTLLLIRPVTSYVM